eukprot:GHVN01058551.1.p1 GENE.GHVN01058551.1~~GHVN01058551.1.p1  ORF type:complete len:287 (-),score=47.92 GHVN01058551.1:1390-2184(-)
MNQTQTVSLERDWVVVIANSIHFSPICVTSLTSPLTSQNDLSLSLSTMNTVMRRIDLSCKMGAPVLGGLILSCRHIGGGASRVLAGCALAGGWYLLTCPVQLFLTRAVYHSFTSLGVKDDGAHGRPHASPGEDFSPLSSPSIEPISDYVLQEIQFDSGIMSSHIGTLSKPTNDEHQGKEEEVALGVMSDMPSVKPPSRNGTRKGMCSRLFSPIALMWSGLSRLSHRRVFVPSLSFCALFASVLDTGSVMTAHSLGRGCYRCWSE